MEAAQEQTLTGGYMLWQVEMQSSVTQGLSCEVSRLSQIIFTHMSSTSQEELVIDTFGKNALWTRLPNISNRHLRPIDILSNVRHMPATAKVFQIL
jgi:hypothetical protein